MKKYSFINNLCGWAAFAVAATTYMLTIEPTTSFWDCPEFISSAYKLEVGHPPGAPFFMLLGNIFTQFGAGAADAARMVNAMSALMSATCILFLFWSITHLTRKLFVDEYGNLTTGQLIATMSSGMVGALAYTFSDTFWFSAVEGEVYASSSLFTAVVFWLILKWETNADKVGSDKWLIFIAYLTGISIGVHLLNLLCIPAIVLIYYFKKNPNATAKGSLWALAGSFVLVAAILYGIVPGLVKVGGWFELLFVNAFGMPFNSGLIVYIVLLIGVIAWGVVMSQTGTNDKQMKLAVLVSIALLGIPFYGHGASSVVIGVVILAALAYYFFSKKIKKNYLPSARLLNTTMLSIMMIVIGYSSYAVIMIRSSANPPMDQNSPEDIFTLGTYLGREQYGEKPLFYGQTFASQPELVVEGNMCRPVTSYDSPTYIRQDKKDPSQPDRYISIKGQPSYKYAQNLLFTRIYSEDPRHVSSYKSWLDWDATSGKQVTYNRCGEMMQLQIPTQLDNIRFFLSYQLNFMYWRYFMWNFVGRQNDIQGHGEAEKGNWVTGFKWIDNLLVGDQDTMPDELKANRGYNVFYCLPLLLGILGIIFQAYHKRKEGIQGFWVVFFLFFMTGIAIVIYLNQTPGQPRERDYAYAGSFYAFTIWIGMGVAWIYEKLRRFKMPDVVVACIASLAILVPIQMASQTWDDHDRSNRYACRDIGQNYLYSCQEEGNPVIFTFGDNDTFPLWYNQDAENVRTDMKVCNLSYLQTDWYIDQMRRPSYDSPGIPINWERWQYAENELTHARVETFGRGVIEKAFREDPQQAARLFGSEPYELNNILEHWIKNPAPQLQDYLKEYVGAAKIFPTDSFYINVDAEAVRRSGMYIPRDTLGNEVPIPSRMTLSLKGKNALMKSELMVLEMVANCNWERPLYMSMTIGPDNQLCFSDYLMQEGLAERITPFNNKLTGQRWDAQRAYDNIMNKFKFGNIKDRNVYIDENIIRMCNAHRNIMVSTAEALLMEGDTAKARKMLDYSLQEIPEYQLPYNYISNSAGTMAELYYMLGDTKKGDYIVETMLRNSEQYILWYLKQSGKRLRLSEHNIRLHSEVYTRLIMILRDFNSPLFEKYYNNLATLDQQIRTKLG